MTIRIGEQLGALLAAAGLGAALALAYDLLRALGRRRGGAVTAALDGAYCVLTAAALLTFSMRVGGGELRLYMAAGVVGGAAAFFLLLSPLLRPLWDFWAGVLGEAGRRLLLPFRWAKTFHGKLHKLCKKGFLFAGNSFIMKNWQREARTARIRAEKKEGSTHGTAAETGARRHVAGGKAGGFGAAGAGGDPASFDPRAKPRRRG